MQEKNRSTKIAAFVLLIIGLALCIGSSYFAKNLIDFTEHALSTKGRVLELVLDKSSGLYAPRVEFQTPTGSSITFQSNLFMRPTYKVGQQINILYDPQNPEHAKINSFSDLWLILVVFGGIGLLFILISLLMLWSPWKRIGEKLNIADNQDFLLHFAVGTLLLVVGLAFLSFSLFNYISSRAFLKHALTAEGEITEVIKTQEKKSDDSGYSTYYYPIIIFTTLSGERVSLRGESVSPASADICFFHWEGKIENLKGKKVEVVYDPDLPQRAYTKSLGSLWGVSFVLGLMGSIFTLLGGCFLCFKTKIRIMRGSSSQSKQIHLKL